jgi:hypothetical protein
MAAVPRNSRRFSLFRTRLKRLLLRQLPGGGTELTVGYAGPVAPLRTGLGLTKIR